MNPALATCLAVLLLAAPCGAQHAPRSTLLFHAGVAPLAGPESTQHGFREGVSLRAAYAYAPFSALEVSLALDAQRFTPDEGGYERHHGLAPGELRISGGEASLRSVSVLATVLGAELGRVTPYLYAGPGYYRYHNRAARFELPERVLTTEESTDTEVGATVGVGARVRVGGGWSASLDAGYVLGAVRGREPLRLVPVRLGAAYRL